MSGIERVGTHVQQSCSHTADAIMTVCTSVVGEQLHQKKKLWVMVDVRGTAVQLTAAWSSASQLKVMNCQLIQPRPLHHTTPKPL
jgi:hypothetical protein